MIIWKYPAFAAMNRLRAARSCWRSFWRARNRLRPTTRQQLPSYPHRHQHIEGARAIAVLHYGRRTRVGEFEQHRVAFKLLGDIEEIAGVEADVDRRGIIIDIQFLDCRTGSRIGDGKSEFGVRHGELDGAATLRRNRRNPVDG